MVGHSDGTKAASWGKKNHFVRAYAAVAASWGKKNHFVRAYAAVADTTAGSGRYVYPE